MSDFTIKNVTTEPEYRCTPIPQSNRLTKLALSLLGAAAIATTGCIIEPSEPGVSKNESSSGKYSSFIESSSSEDSSVEESSSSEMYLDGMPALYSSSSSLFDESSSSEDSSVDESSSSEMYLDGMPALYSSSSSLFDEISSSEESSEEESSSLDRTESSMMLMGDMVYNPSSEGSVLSSSSEVPPMSSVHMDTSIIIIEPYGEIGGAAIYDPNSDGSILPPEDN